MSNYSIVTKSERVSYVFLGTMLSVKCKVYLEMRELKREILNREENYN